jgi:hypothetical protein
LSGGGSMAAAMHLDIVALSIFEPVAIFLAITAVNKLPAF